MNKLSLVLLIKILSHHSHNELLRFTSIQLKSFRKFLDFKMIDKFYIISPREDILLIKTELIPDFKDFPFVFIDENDICLFKGNLSGWVRQMILKLAVARHIDSEFYLTLDTDVFLTKKLSLNDLLREGRLIFQKESANSHAKWWESSSYLLGKSSPQIKNNDPVMGVTPEILVTEVVRNLCKDIVRINDADDFAQWLADTRMGKKKLAVRLLNFIFRTAPASQYLFSDKVLRKVNSCNWTEYSLYWTYLILNDLKDRYYVETKDQLYGNCIWGDSDTSGISVDKIVESIFTENSSYYFSVIQSSMKKVSVEELAGLMDERF